MKGKAVDARQIGRELKVRYVLEGGVRRVGRTVRVNAQLIDAGTGAHLWAEQMDVDQGALATSQDNFGIASRLAKTLSVELVNVEGRRAPQTNPDAVDLTNAWLVDLECSAAAGRREEIRHGVRRRTAHRSGQ